MKKLFWMLMGCSLLVAAESTSLIDLSDTLYVRMGNSGKEVLLSEKFTPATKFERGHWNRPCRVHGGHPERDRILACCSSRMENDGLRIITTEGIREFRTAAGGEPMVSNELSHQVTLPSDAAGRLLRADFQYTGRGVVWQYIVFKPGDHKVVHGNARVVPPGATEALCILRLVGPGEIKVTAAEITLMENEAPDGQPEILASPHGYLDEKFYLPEKEAFPLYFMIKRERSRKYRNVLLHLELPPGYRLAGVENIQEIREARDGGAIIEFTRSLNMTITDGNWCPWRQPLVFLISDLPASDELAEMRYFLEVEGRKLPPRSLKLGTMKPLTVAVPSRFYTGVMQQCGFQFLDKAGTESMVALLEKSGFNTLQGLFAPDFNAALQREKFSRLGNRWGIRDGYPRGQTPPFVDINGKQFHQQLCPIESAKAGRFDADLTEVLKNADHFSINWEAYSSDYKGCFCDKCFKAFALYAGIPEDRLKDVWPKNVIARYHDIWVEFRSHQHAAIIAGLEESMTRLSRQQRRDGHFVPMCSRALFSDSATFGKQYSPKDFLKHLSLINIWGPYTHSAGLYRPYQYLPGKYLTHYFEVRDVKRFVDKYADKPVGILGLPYGCHGYNVNPPEAIALETIDNFLSGYAGSLVYWFQFDFRYYHRMAEANGKIAAYEDMVTEWPRTNELKVETASPIITPDHIRIWLPSSRLCPEIDSAGSVVQTQAYRQDNRILAAVGNFWEKGGVFATLSIPGLTGEYVVAQPHAGIFRRTSGAELAKGVMVYIPALTWEFFLLEPWEQGKKYGTEHTDEDIQKHYNALLPRLTALLSKEDSELALRRQESSIVEFNFDETPEIQGGQVVVRELRRDGKQAIAVKAPAYSAVMEPSQGGQLGSLILAGEEIAAPWIGRIGFLKDRKFICDTHLQVKNIRSQVDGVVVELQRSNVSGLDITLAWTFCDSGITEQAEVVNNQQHSLKLIPRFHNMLRYMTVGESFAVGNRTIPVTPENRLFVTQDDHEKLAAVLKGDVEKLAIQSVDFSSSRLKSRLRYITGNPLYGIYQWCNPGATVGSFEPLFVPVELSPGSKTVFAQQFLFEQP